MSRLKVLHGFSTFAPGGPEVRFARQVRYWGDAFDHLVSAMDGDYGAMSLLRGMPNIRLVEIPVRKGSGLANVPRLARILGDLRPDLLVTYNWGAIEWAFAAAIRSVPHVHIEEGFGPEEIDRRLLRRSCTRAIALRLSKAAFATVSSGLMQIAHSEWRIPRRRCHLIPNGIDMDRFAEIAARGRESRFAVAGEPVIGTLAGLRPEKRVDRIIDAAALAGTGVALRLVIAGDGPERDALEARVRRLSGSTRATFQFLGHVSDPAAVLAELDLFVLGSDTEQMPVSALEAMACGLPVVATDVGDLSRMLPDTSPGQLVAKSAQSLAERIVELLRVPAIRAEIGASNRRAVMDRYQESDCFDRWAALYRAQARS